MARAILQHVVQDSSGNVQPYALVTVYEQDGSTLLTQTMYTRGVGGAVQPNPMRADQYGLVVAYLDAPQRVVVSVGGRAYNSEFVADSSEENTGIRGELLARAGNNGGQAGPSPRNLGWTANDITFFDATTVNTEARGFQLAVFDGERVLFLPYGDHRRTGAYIPGPRSGLLAYDVRLPFQSVDSYQYANIAAVIGNAKAEGWLGGCTDPDGWVYFAPYFTKANGTTEANTLMCRWNSKSGNIADAAAWEVFDLSTHPYYGGAAGWCNAVYCEGYIYYSPLSHYSESGAVNPHHGHTYRYSVAGQFNDPNSWAGYDLGNVHANAKGFQGIITDGRYIYFIPFVLDAALTRSGRIVRYDSNLSFISPGSYQTFDLATLDATAVAFDGAVYDGRRIWLVPWGTQSPGLSLGTIAIFDTEGPVGGAANELANANNWLIVNLATLLGAKYAGYQWGWCDGQYVYFVPSFNSAYTSVDAPAGRVPPYLRCNIHQRPDEVASWQAIEYGDLASTGIVTDAGYTMPASTGGAWDGRYGYCAPYGFPGQQVGKIARIRTYVPDPAGVAPAWRSTDHFTTLAGNTGFGTKTPMTGAKVDVAGGIRSTGVGAALGYGTGSGGVVTQLTSKTTGVTLNKINGQITMHNAALAGGATVGFAVTNSLVTATDVIIPVVVGGGAVGAYRAWVAAVANGSFSLAVQNITAGSLSESPVIGFAVIKAVAS
jgi:hypothetical protein